VPFAPLLRQEIYSFIFFSLPEGGMERENPGARERRSQERASDDGLRFDHERSMRQKGLIIGKLEKSIDQVFSRGYGRIAPKVA
jgi:hypothetical protein